MLFGLVRCVDCDEKLYYCTSNSFETRQAHFKFSTACKKDKAVCDTYFFRAVVLVEGTLQHMRLATNVLRIALGAKRSEDAIYQEVNLAKI